MKIIGKQAIRHFFASPSFEMIYSEAVANALDAGADHITIGIQIKSFQAKESIKMVIRDNGHGFTDDNFKRFTSLMQSKDKNHKGLGRLVYLAYFNNVHVESTYSGSYHRIFDFNDDFIGCDKTSKLTENADSYSQFTFSDFSNSKFSKYDDLKPCAVKDLLKKLFMARMFMMKSQQQKLQIDISLDVAEPNEEKEFVSSNETLTLDDLPHLKQYKDELCDMFDNKFDMLYSVLHDDRKERVTASICVDGRAIPFPRALKSVELPNDVSAIFMLNSSFFDAKADDSRQNVNLTKDEARQITQLFQKMIAKVLIDEVPSIKERNDQCRNDLEERYPHLNGMFPTDAIGLMNETMALEYARDRFFKEQKDILEATEMTDELYAKSLSHSVRVLAEYILYRNRIIEKISQVNSTDKESTIHNLIVPMRTTFDGSVAGIDLYRNNAWVLDDKYMTYKSILSDKDLKSLIEKIAVDRDDLKSTDVRPDIAVVFSDDIEKVDHPVDVVIVELKKKGLGYLDNKRVLDQIRMRARRLVSLYPDKIQRMWFFGVVDFDPELRIEIDEQGWSKIYSTDEVYYNQIEVRAVDKDMKPISNKKVPVPVTLMSFDALIGDAKARNDTFLKILRTGVNSFAKKDSERQ